MTLEEAKAIFEDGIAIKEQIPNLAQAYELAIKALEKGISVSREIRHGNYFCPKCGSNVEYQGYCHACGQRVY